MNFLEYLYEGTRLLVHIKTLGFINMTYSTHQLVNKMCSQQACSKLVNKL